jgi:hypothetical protein
MNSKESSYFLINQHIRPPFWFSDEQVDALIANLDRRRELLSDLFPWKDLNFGIDHRWAALLPYHMTKKPGDGFEISLRILNHASNSEDFDLDLSLPDGFVLDSGSTTLSVGARKEQQLSLRLHAIEDIRPGLYVVPALVKNEAGDLSLSMECCVEIQN